MARGPQKNGTAQSSAASGASVTRGGKPKKVTKKHQGTFKPPAQIRSKDGDDLAKLRREVQESTKMRKDRPARSVPKVDYSHDGVIAKKQTPETSPQPSPNKAVYMSGPLEPKDGAGKDGGRMDSAGRKDLEGQMDDVERKDDDDSEFYKCLFEERHEGDQCPWSDEEGKQAYYEQWLAHQKYTESIRKNQKEDENDTIETFQPHDPATGEAAEVAADGTEYTSPEEISGEHIDDVKKRQREGKNHT